MSSPRVRFSAPSQKWATPLPRKVLMLHGYGQNAYFMSRYTQEFVKACPDVEFVYLDAPFQLHPVDYDSSVATTVTTLDPAACTLPSSTPAQSETPRGWFRIVNFGGHTIDGVETSLALLREILSAHRFEAIMGFSQGAAMAELVASMLEHPDNFSEMRAENGDAVHPPLKYIVSCSGFILRGPSAAWNGQVMHPTWPGLTLNTPVLHLVGSTDPVVPKERSEIIMSYHRNKRVEEHVGGHFVPQHARWSTFFTSFFKSPFGEVRSPTARRLTISTTSNLTKSQPLVFKDKYKTGQTLMSPLDDGSGSGASSPDSMGPSTPTEEKAEMFPETQKMNIDEMQLASMWPIYDGLVYRGD